MNAPKKPRLPGGRGLGEIGGRTGHLAAREEPLGQPHHQQRAGSGHPDGVGGRQQSDGHGGGAHAHDREDQHRLAADAVPEPAEEDTAERPHQEGAAEDRQRGQQRGGGVVAGEEVRSEHDGQIAVDTELVVFDGGSRRGGQRRLAGAGRGPVRARRGGSCGVH
nr:hypothetical protein [Streptomyces hygroscopicus]